jgi:uncharacterized membrane protein YfcA
LPALDLTSVLLYLLTGCFAGFSAGLLGIGGGLIIVPVLFFVFSSQGYESEALMHMALATSLATIITTSISSTLAHHKKRAVLWPVFFSLAPALCAGAWLGAMLASKMDTAVLKPVFGIFELFVAALMLSQYQSRRHQLRIRPANAIIGGGIIGSLSAIIGIGGGTLTVPFLHWHNIDIKHAVATSAACGLPIAIFATASYVISGWQLPAEFAETQNSLGYVQLDAFFFIALSSFIFAPLGARTAHRLSSKNLKKTFALLLLALGLKMLLS